MDWIIEIYENSFVSIHDINLRKYNIYYIIILIFIAALTYLCENLMSMLFFKIYADTI